MPSVNVSVDRNWTQLETGASVSLNIQPKNKRCEWFVAASTPPATTSGAIINPEDFRNFDLDSGENLYARSTGGTVVIQVTD